MFRLSIVPACSAASPPMAVPREAQAPPPYGEIALSPPVTLTCPMDKPTLSATIWATLVNVPCP